jgi:hypothetical protein
MIPKPKNATRMSNVSSRMCGELFGLDMSEMSAVKQMGNVIARHAPKQHGPEMQH